MAASHSWQIPSPGPTPATGLGQLAPRITPSPSCCESSEIVVELATTLLIRDYPRYFDTPVSTFQPVYSALPDGSLTTLPFINDLASSYVSLLATAMLAIIFLRNIIVSFDYLGRAIVKRKTLFYLLLSSQLLSLGIMPLLASFFNTHLDCTAAVSVASVTAGVSVALLMTGVLGLKAYRCLDSSRVVLLVLAALFCASSAALALQVVNTRGVRRLSAGCSTFAINPLFARLYVLIQLAHALFLCFCFLYAVWKSRSSPAARGRLSLRVSLDDFPDSAGSHKQTPQTWWRHLLGLRHKVADLPVVDVSPPTEDKATVPNLRIDTMPDLHLEQPLHSLVEPGARSHTPTPSLSWFIPPMELFHKVMKDELCYTTTITGTMVFLALSLVFGLNFENNLDMFGWLGANWAIISLLAIHSFGRVVRRHEKEALLQHRSAWAESPVNRNAYSRRTYPGSPRKTQDDANDPFSDSRALRDSVSSWNGESLLTPTPAAYMRGRLSNPDVPSSIRTSLELADGGASDWHGAGLVDGIVVEARDHTHISK